MSPFFHLELRRHSCIWTSDKSSAACHLFLQLIRHVAYAAFPLVESASSSSVLLFTRLEKFLARRTLKLHEYERLVFFRRHSKTRHTILSNMVRLAGFGGRSHRLTGISSSLLSEACLDDVSLPLRLSSAVQAMKIGSALQEGLRSRKKLFVDEIGEPIVKSSAETAKL
jgi:hypothetical protein